MEIADMITAENFVGNFSYSRYETIYQFAKEKEHRYWVGAVPVSLNLMKFYNELKHKRPDIVMRIDRSPARYNGMDYAVFADVGISFASSPEFKCGEIGMTTDKKGSAVLFTVTSKRIKNEKFAQHSEGYHIKATKNFANAVKNALQYIKPVTFDELRDDADSELYMGLTHMKNPYHDKLYQATSIGRAIIEEEVRHMVSIGYTPTTALFKQAMQLLIEEGAEIKEMSNYNPRKCLVWVTKDRVVYQVDGNEVCIAYTSQDIPDYISEKVAVLQISDSKNAIKDVGMKVSDTVYWLFV